MIENDVLSNDAVMAPVDHCRVCGSHDLAFLFSIGKQYVNNFVEPGKEHTGPQVPIELELCRGCTLVQARYTAPQDFMYSRHYWYLSGVTATMREALRDITESIEAMVPLQADDIVLDIGSNDGTLLRSYSVPGLVRVGVEPANNLVEEGSRGIDTFIHDFWNHRSYAERVGRRAKVITAIGMFYDLPDPNQFIADIADALDMEGVFVSQLMCLRNMVDSLDVGNLAHEHLEFYSLKSLRYLFGRNGLEIFDMEHNRVNGGSFRLFARHIGATAVSPMPYATERLWTARQREYELEDETFYAEFFAELEDNRQKTVDFIQQAVQNGKRVWVYGASTKGNVILQYYGLDHTLIAGAAERSPAKWGKVTIGTGIPIYSEEYARAANPDFFLVLPYAFLDEFIAREAAWRSHGGRFIVPLPEFRVV